MSDSTEEEEDVIQDLKSRRFTRLGGPFPACPDTFDFFCAIVAWDESRAIFTGVRMGRIRRGYPYPAEDSCFVYNKETMETETLPSLLQARTDHAAAVVGNHLFVIGGSYEHYEHYGVDSIEVLDLSDPREWTMYPVKLKTPRSFCSAVVVNEQDIYIVGGRNNGLTLDSVEILNTVTQTMTPGPSLLKSRSAFAAALIGDSIVVAGGYELITHVGYETIDDCEQLSMREGSDEEWQPLNSMTTERKWHHGLSFGNCMVVAGGSGDHDGVEEELTTMEVWSGTTGTWTQLPARLPVGGHVRGFVKLGDDLVCFVRRGDDDPSIHCLFSASGLLEHQRRQIRFNELIADERPEIVIPLLLEGLHQRGWTSLFYECIRETNGRLIHRRGPTIEDDTEEEDVIQDLKSRRFTRLGGAFPAKPDAYDTCAIVAWDESRAIFTGGFRGGLASNTVFVYNKETMEFETLPPMLRARWEHAAVIVGEKLFVIGGIGIKIDGEIIGLKRIEVLDLSDLRKWTIYPVRLKKLRSFCSAVVVNEQEIYIIGGIDGSGEILDSVEILNTVTQTMTPGPSLLQSRGTFAAALIGDSIVVAGGLEGSERAGHVLSIDDCEQLSMREGSDEEWQPLNSMTTERIFPHGLSFGNCMVVAGGSWVNDDGVEEELTTMEVWSGTTGTWTQLPARLPVGGHVRGFVKLGDDLVCFVGGDDSDVYCLFSASGLLEHRRRQIRFNELIADERPEIVIPLLLEGLHQRGWTSLFYECVRETNGRLIPRREPTIEDDTMA